jgi:DHA2 family multidrug resistance protein
MMLVGGVLNASTVLQPQFLQQLLGYTAPTPAGAHRGRHLAARRHALCRHGPPASFPRATSPRSASAFFAFSFWFHHAPQPRHELRQRLMAARHPTGAHSLLLHLHHHGGLCPQRGLPKEQSNQVAGLINFVRNIGGSIFIAVTGASRHQP